MEEPCVEQKLKFGQVPDYICKNGKKHYLSKEEKKDYQYGGPLPVICPLIRGDCPDISGIVDTHEARDTCNKNDKCQFIGNQVLVRGGPNHCVPKSQPNCITLTEHQLTKDDKELTDDPNVCNRMGVGGIFDRGTGDNTYTRKGDPTTSSIKIGKGNKCFQKIK